MKKLVAAHRGCCKTARAIRAIRQVTCGLLLGALIVPLTARADPTPVEVVNDVTTIPIADDTFVSFAGTCNPNGGDTWVATLLGAVPLGKRLVIDSFSMEISLPAIIFAHAYIRPVTPGQPVDMHARQWIPLQNQGVGFSYGAQQRRVLNANLPVHEIMDSGDRLDVVIQASDILAATQSACFFAVLGHYVPMETRIGVGL